LSGRIEEINIGWEHNDLLDVLKKGSIALNISFSERLSNNIIEASFGNVGLLQRIAENICLVENIYYTQDCLKEIDSDVVFQKAIDKIIQDVSQRYNKIKNVFERGFRSDTQLQMYYQVFRYLTMVDDKKLIDGVHQNEILKEIQKWSTKMIRPLDLTQALDRIERLQAQRDITPLLVSFNKSLKEVSLSDREFLFYRKYAHIEWEWSEEHEELCNYDSSIPIPRTVFPFMQMQITDDNPVEFSARVNHPTLGERKFTKDDYVFSNVVNKLLDGDEIISILDNNIFGSDFTTIQFYLGFFYLKKFIFFEYINDNTILIKLDPIAKIKMHKKI
jgi:hypothetical protein